VVQGLRQSGRINDVIIGSLPFVLAMFAMLAIISIWPNLALWLPRIAGG
jgi:C4-dicarboxylate transporter DctM subunit